MIKPSNVIHNVTDLTPFTGHYFRVAAVNDAGVGPFSRSYKGFTTKPDCEFIYVCIVTAKNVKLNNKMATQDPLTYPFSPWSSVQLVLQHNVRDFSKDNVE